MTRFTWWWLVGALPMENFLNELQWEEDSEACEANPPDQDDVLGDRLRSSQVPGTPPAPFGPSMSPTAEAMLH